MVFLAVAVVTAIAVAAGPSRARQIPHLAPEGVPAAAFPSPSRPVADIVSPSRSNDKHRDAIDESGQIAKLMDLKAGMTVGDIGAGNGYHALRLAKVVGPSGRVVAQDVTAKYLAEAEKRARRRKVANVTFALGEPHDPRLPPASLDAALLAHMYHEVEQPYAFLYNLAPALKPGARVGIVDIDKPTADHGTPLALLRCELKAVGYREVAVHDLEGDAGYLAVFEAPDMATRTAPGDIVACKAAG